MAEAIWGFCFFGLRFNTFTFSSLNNEMETAQEG
jgi:hypothetical protein